MLRLVNEHNTLPKRVHSVLGRGVQHEGVGQQVLSEQVGGIRVSEYVTVSGMLVGFLMSTMIPTRACVPPRVK